jgi:hypothetical protein
MQEYLGAQGAVVGELPDYAGLQLYQNSIAKYQTTQVRCVDCPLTMNDGPPGPAWGSLEIWKFATPIFIDSIGMKMHFTKTSNGIDDDWHSHFAYGTTPVSDVQVGMTGNEVDIHPETEIQQASNGYTFAGGLHVGSSSPSGDPLSLYLNIIINKNDHNLLVIPCDLILNGTILFTWLHFDVRD